MLPGSSLNGSPRLASLVAAAVRFFSLSASRLARALARSSDLELGMRVRSEGRNLLRRHHPPCAQLRARAGMTPPVCREHNSTRTNSQKTQCEAADAVEALDPGVPYESRWAPYDRAHGPGQGQFPKGSIRPRG